MRADTFYRLAANKTIAPVLRNIMEERGTWGVSHTRVPTESRPGHVALIAGLYEDPSAITKGWKENPVEFDSLFNRSTLTLAWGSPDILPMFSKACGERMLTEMYRPEDQDFSGTNKSTSWLDEWVFQRFEAFVARLRLRSDGDSRLWHRMHGDGVVFFFHLLASDTAGHTFKPHSWEYENNVRLIDEGVSRVAHLVEDFFGNDGQTAYLLTSDHGMTDWGSHGAGDSSETQTPLLAWGAGVPSPIPSESTACVASQRHDLPKVDDSGWDLPVGVCRHDAWQADIAPTMATLIGVPIPVNSVGSLLRPYLDLDPRQMAQAAFTNARQMLEQHAHRRAAMESPQGVAWALYQPFAPLPPHAEGAWVTAISEFIDAHEYDRAIAKSDELFALASLGVDYHHRYHKTLLLWAISLAFVGWILLLLLLTSTSEEKKGVESGHAFEAWVDVPALTLSALVSLYLSVFACPLQYYVYCVLPISLWWVLLRAARRRIGWRCAQMHFPSVLSSCCFVALYLGGVEILVLSFFHRWLLSLGMGVLALQPLLRTTAKARGAALYWVLSCALLAIFPFMPVVGKEGDTALVVSACLLFAGVAVLVALLAAGSMQWSLCIRAGVALPLAAWSIARADQSFVENQGLPLACQALSWVLSVLSLAWILIGRHTQFEEHTPVRQMTLRLTSVFASLAVPYLLLSVRHEGFFLLVLAMCAHAWLTVEHSFAQGPSSVAWDNVRISYTFVFLIVTSFFGTGNVASVNSFDPAWVRRFLSVFSPHVMGALILSKTCIPFLVVACALRAVTLVRKVKHQGGDLALWRRRRGEEVGTQRLFLMVLALSDVCGVHFLHWVRNTGSWLDIGTSLSHFVIQEAMVLFLLLLYGLACCLIPSPSSEHFPLREGAWGVPEAKSKRT
ncbi:GPI ethanolamine phosphate transferase 1 isoform X2 [Ischnura elegans]|nr:GPI ethanolamine phosphate transferase 1 isoform X2 [Ischnura elegans]